MEEKDGSGRESREWSRGAGPRRGWQSTLWAGGLVLALSASLPSRDSKQAGCFLPMFGVSPKDLSLDQLQEGKWQNWNCAEPPVPRE